MHLFNIMVMTIIMMAFFVCAVFGSDSVVNSDFEGKSLVAMGNLLDSPLLKLLGRTFEKLEKDVLNFDKFEQLEKDVLNIDNKTTFVLGQVNKDNSSLEQRLVSERRELIDIICQLHPCTEWETWSSCSAKKKETFGAQTRSRTCGVKASKLCSSTEQEQKETDTRICEGRTQCPIKYTETKNGYCMSVHTEGKTWTSAQAVCKQEGGYLMNIDSKLKTVDVNNTLKKMSHTSASWIDGTRTLPGGEWRYKYGPQDTAYINWAGGMAGSSGDCRTYSFDSTSQSWYWYDVPCSYTYSFICEIV